MSDATHEVYAIRYGTRETTRSDVYLNFGLYGEADVPMTMDYYFWLIRRGDRAVVVDCGFSPAGGARRNRTTLISPADALRRFGLDAATVSTLIITHGHYDHIGNLSVFAAADVHLSRTEFDFWTGPMGTRGQFAPSAEASEIEDLRALHAAGRLRFADSGTTIEPGIDLIEVGGHTPGQLVVTVATESGPIVLTSDALHYYEELERDWPFLHAAELERMYLGFDRLRAMAEDGAVLVAGHDPAVMDRFTAGEGALRGIAVRIA